MSRHKVDLDWSDEGLFQALKLDTEFVFARMTEATLTAVRKGDHRVVLDVGCGRGSDALRLCGPGRLVVGLEPSRIMLRTARENGAGSGLQLVQGRAEEPPFKSAVFDCVVCKGALDHFSDPALSLRNLYQNLKPGGKLVVAVANFESLSCLLARKLYPLMQTMRGGGNTRRKFWDPPEDHLHVFYYANLKRLLGGLFRLEKIEGTSIMWGFPYWGNFLEKLPRSVALGILTVTGSVASRLPLWGDVIIAVGRR